jgi:hypothetical protein
MGRSAKPFIHESEQPTGRPIGKILGLASGRSRNKFGTECKPMAGLDRMFFTNGDGVQYVMPTMLNQKVTVRQIIDGGAYRNQSNLIVPEYYGTPPAGYSVQQDQLVPINNSYPEVDRVYVNGFVVTSYHWVDPTDHQQLSDARHWLLGLNIVPIGCSGIASGSWDTGSIHDTSFSFSYTWTITLLDPDKAELTSCTGAYSTSSSIVPSPVDPNNGYAKSTAWDMSHSCVITGELAETGWVGQFAGYRVDITRTNNHLPNNGFEACVSSCSPSFIPRARNGATPLRES